jgi:tRNA threonylcarbamoyl adenosine modification protein YjeE
MTGSDRSDAARRVVVRIADEAALGPMASVLAATLPPHAFLALDGDLGAGKTTFVKALAAAAGIDPVEVVSPTFGLIHIHLLPDGHRAGRLVHADLYRLAGCDDLFELGWEELIAPPGWVAAEWSTRIGAALPDDRLDILLEVESETARRASFTSRGSAFGPLFEAISRLDSVSPG